MDSEPIPSTTSGRSLARNSVLNLLGQLAPMVVALIAIPLLVRELGSDRFGVLALAWMAAGYFSLFDLGLGRALTQVVAERIGSREESDIPALVWTGLALMIGMGLVGALILAGIASLLVRVVLNIPTPLQDEALGSFYLLALGLPFITSTAGLRGVLEARQEFAVVNALRVPMGVFTYLGPLLVLPFTSGLVPVVGVLVLGRVLGWGGHLTLCVRRTPELRRKVHLRREAVRPLLRFGSWMTVTNIISPMMVYFDRFVIGAVLTVSAVAYYAVPYELVTKAWVIPGALLGVLFPAFAVSIRSDVDRFRILYDRGVRLVFLMLFPVTLVLVALAPEGLTLWLGAEFGDRSATVLRWLAVGVLINSIGQVPFSALQGIGRPDVTGKLHLLELPIYVALLWWLTGRYGIAGAAGAWVGRVAVDHVLLFVIGGQLLPAGRHVLRRMVLLLAPALLVLGMASAIEETTPRVVYLFIAGILFVPLAWYHVLTAEERAVLLHRRDATGWRVSMRRVG